MTDTSRPPAVLPAFTPVPRQKARSNGWSEKVQRDFIEALAETGSVKAACRRVGRADHGAYLLRRHPDAEAFRHAWDVALDIGMRRIEDVAMDRALNGVEVPVYSYGKLVGTRVVYNDRLLMFMLRNRAPERFTGGRPKALNAIGAAELKRQKARWRKEWEREAAIQDAARDMDLHADFAQELAQVHRQWFTTLGPEARAAYRAFREAEERDRQLLAAEPDAAADGAAQPDAPSGELRWQACAPDADWRAAEAEYDEWFSEERRAKVWWMVDVVFGA